MCDLCLDKITIDIKNTYKQVIKFSDQPIEEEGIITLSYKEHKINVAHVLYETLNFAIPIKKVCSIDTNKNKICDQNMLNRLENLANKEKIINDPRWEALNKLKFN